MSSAHFTLEMFTPRAQDPPCLCLAALLEPFPNSAPQNTLKTLSCSKDEATEAAVSTGLHHTPAKRTSFSKDLNKSFGFNLAEKSISKQIKQEPLDTSVSVYKNIIRDNYAVKTKAL